MKKSMIVLLAVALLTALLTLPVGAEESVKIESLVVLGDSISTGYGLEGAATDRPSYANLVAEALGLTRGQGYTNYAVDGYTSKNILSKAKANATTLGQADVVLLTCGGNDVLGKMLEIVYHAAGGTSMDIRQNIIAMMNMSEADINAKLYTDASKAVIDNALTAYRANMVELVAYLTETAPQARIIFLTQYNPLSGVAMAPVLDAYAEDVIGRLNAVMRETATAGGCELADTYAVMVGKGGSLSNILLSDIHPNEMGHKAMAEAVKAYLGIGAPAVSETTTATTEAITQVSTSTPETTSSATQTTTSTPETTVLTSETSTATTTDAVTSGEGESPEPEDSKTSTVPLVIAIGVLAAGVCVTVIVILARKKR